MTPLTTLVGMPVPRLVGPPGIVALSPPYGDKDVTTALVMLVDDGRPMVPIGPVSVGRVPDVECEEV